MFARTILIIAAAVSLSCASLTPDMTGQWRLDLEQSRWEGVRKPLSVVVAMQHREPELRYSGSVTYADNDTRSFEFEGAIDGQAYPAVRSYGTGKLALRRTGKYSVESEFRSDDGKFRETSQTALSADAKRMIRKIHLSGPQGEEDWTEVYVKD